VDVLRTSIGVKDGILLFSESGQFLLSAGDSDILSPETAAITSISDYTSNTGVDPVRVGENIFFVTRKDSSSGVREYFYSSGSDITDSSDITAQVSSLLPIALTDLSGSSTENILFCAGRTLDTLFVYQYLSNGQERVVSAWTKWSFNSSAILFSEVFNDYLYVVLQRGTKITIEKVALSTNRRYKSLSDEICLDESGSSVGLGRVFSSGRTTFVFPRLFTKTPILFADTTRPQDDISIGDKITPFSITTSTTSTTVVLNGDWSSSQFGIGASYLFSHEFSSPHLQVGEGEVDVEGRLQVRNYTIQVNNTGECEFKVIYAEPGILPTTVFVNDVLNWSQITDMATLSTGAAVQLPSYSYFVSRTFPDKNISKKYTLLSHPIRVPVMCQNTKYRLLVLSESYTPVTLVKAQIEAMYHKRSRLV
jgi:hypothetical protein